MKLPPTLSLVAALAMTLPPVDAEARVITIMMCGGEILHMLVPGTPDDSGQRRDCPKACHVLMDRKEKADGKRGCC